MNPEQTLMESLPPRVERLPAVSHDRYQTRTANRQFASKQLPEHDYDASQHIVCVVVDAIRTTTSTRNSHRISPR